MHCSLHVTQQAVFAFGGNVISCVRRYQDFNDAYKWSFRVTPDAQSKVMRPVITKAVRAFAIAIIVLLVGKKRPLF